MSIYNVYTYVDYIDYLNSKYKHKLTNLPICKDKRSIRDMCARLNILDLVDKDYANRMHFLNYLKDQNIVKRPIIYELQHEYPIERSVIARILNADSYDKPKHVMIINKYIDQIVSSLTDTLTKIHTIYLLTKSGFRNELADRLSTINTMYNEDLYPVQKRCLDNIIQSSQIDDLPSALASCVFKDHQLVFIHNVCDTLLAVFDQTQLDQIRSPSSPTPQKISQPQKSINDVNIYTSEGLAAFVNHKLYQHLQKLKLCQDKRYNQVCRFQVDLNTCKLYDLDILSFCNGPYIKNKFYTYLQSNKVDNYQDYINFAKSITTNANIYYTLLKQYPDHKQLYDIIISFIEKVVTPFYSNLLRAYYRIILDTNKPTYDTSIFDIINTNTKTVALKYLASNSNSSTTYHYQHYEQVLTSINGITSKSYSKVIKELLLSTKNLSLMRVVIDFLESGLLLARIQERIKSSTWVPTKKEYEKLLQYFDLNVIQEFEQNIKDNYELETQFLDLIESIQPDIMDIKKILPMYSVKGGDFFLNANDSSFIDFILDSINKFYKKHGGLATILFMFAIFIIVWIILYFVSSLFKLFGIKRSSSFKVKTRYRRR